MWKWIIIALAAFALYKLVFNDRGRKSKDEDKKRERKIATGEMVKDPVCGAYVDVEGSISVRDGNKVLRFCSYDCREKYLESLESQGRELPSRSHSDDD